MTEPALVDGGNKRASMLVYVGDRRAKETSQRVRLCAKTTKETPRLPTVLSPPIAVE